ncbi:MAG TPA: hypothetical protein GX003_00570 [Acholeplasmataceae bacterium]|jgi:hypothetical protein|nr:hypothetical protein [Acholeplasmataceae bacterium]
MQTKKDKFPFIALIITLILMVLTISSTIYYVITFSSLSNLPEGFPQERMPNLVSLYISLALGIVAVILELLAFFITNITAKLTFRILLFLYFIYASVNNVIGLIKLFSLYREDHLLVRSSDFVIVISSLFIFLILFVLNYVTLALLIKKEKDANPYDTDII